MKVKFSAFLIITALVVVATACSKGGGGSSSTSSTTGWDYNDPENGGFEVVSGSEQETGPGLVLIEGGTFSMGRVEQDVTYDWNNAPRRVTVSSFYMDQTEVRNVDYREYLHWISRVFIDYPLVYQKSNA